MRPASSLFAKILTWFFLNMILVAAVLALFFTFQSKIDLPEIFGHEGASRLRSTGMLVAHDLTTMPQERWPEILARHAGIHGVAFTLVLHDGRHYSSTDDALPESVTTAVSDALRQRPPKRPFPPSGPPGGPPKDPVHPNGGKAGGESSAGIMQRPPPRHLAVEDRKPHLMFRTNDPNRYWAGIRIPLPPHPPHPPPAAFLFAVSDSFTGNGFFFDPAPWLLASAAVILISVLFWIPMVRNITRPLGGMTRATEKIARGRFEVSIKESRTDEIGRLAKSINHMSARLSAFVTGQKRFLGDVAHELGSPIARIQFGLGALEQRVEKQYCRRVMDVLEDVEHLSNLVSELLAFSRADLNADTVRLEKTDLLPVVETAVRREATPADRIDVDINPDICVFTSADLLIRALANVLRNSIKYSGDAGPIKITAKRKDRRVEIEIRDMGPGVADDQLAQLFEPFFRPEASRDRDSGGVGLGLAIVKTCIETCQGSVSAANVRPVGFSVSIVLTSC